MTESTANPAAAVRVETTVDDHVAPDKARGLRGNMGTPSVIFLTIACMSPLTAAAGYVSLVIAFGNGIGAPLMYLLVGAVVSLFAVGYLAMVKDVARPGGLYTYITAGLGKRIGLGGGYVAMMTYLMAEVGLAIFGGISLSFAIENSFGGSALPWYWCSVPFIVLATVASYFNVGLSAKLLGIILVVEIVFVMGLNTVVAFSAGPTNFVGSADSFSLTGLLSGSLPLAFLFALTNFSGFESPALYYEETTDPRRTIPRATYTIIAIVSVLYAFTAWMLLVGFGPDQALQIITGDPSAAFSNLFIQYLGQGAYQVCVVFLQTGIFASLLAGNNVLSRYFYSAGTDGVLPRRLGRANTRTGAPTNASVAVGILIALFVAAIALTGSDPNQLLALVSGAGTYGFLLMFLLASLAITVFFVKRPGVRSARRARILVTSAVSMIIFGTVLVYVSGNLGVLVGDNLAFGVILQVIMWACFVAGVVQAVYLAARRPTVFARIGREDAIVEAL